jgi:hypothetical protein
MRWNLTLEERFWSKVDKNGPVPECRPDLGPCWIWLAYVDPGGYGRFSRFGKSDYAHIVAYELVNGVIDPGLERDHLCRNRACPNPSHLEAVPHRVNTLRGEGCYARQARRAQRA